MKSASPFATYANATLTLSVPTSELTSDAYGNPVPKYRQFQLTALLQPSSNPRITYQAGSDKNAQAMSGYLVEPQTLPDTVKLPVVAEAVITTGIDRQEKGNFEIFPTVQDPFLIAQKVEIVTEIVGIFRRIN